MSQTSPVTETLANILMRCRTVLGNMAAENEGAIFNRWPINHEPLRADAKNLVPLIDQALAAHHTEALKALNDYHDHHPLGHAQSPSVNLMQRVWANLYYNEEDAGNTFQQTLNEVVDWLAARNALPAVSDTSTDRSLTIDEVPSCGQENDYIRANTSIVRDSK